MNPQFPIYIPSKGRAESRITMRYLEGMKVPYHVIVEEQEYPVYASVITPARLLVLPKSYQEVYETCDHLGDTRGIGSGPARNFAWDHAQAAGAAFHWVIDDNIRGWYRLRHNTKFKVADGTIFRAMEDFCLRYTNVAMAGPNYEMFVPRKIKVPPYITNTRIYSCNLIRTDAPFRWRSRMNEDTDLSLRMLKEGWVTVLFNAFLAKKIATMRMAGGNTDAFYAQGGTAVKAQVLVDLHPDVARVVHKFQRWHHYVDYSGFTQQLIRKPGLEIPEGPNEYGMRLYRTAA